MTSLSPSKWSMIRVLIAPLWNWNYYYPNDDEFGEAVLIAPLWNWNKSPPKPSSSNVCSNRTFMELKLWTEFVVKMKNTVLIAPLWNWNHHIRLGCRCFKLGSNRTFMELKCNIKGLPRKSLVVLIAPLWNWNYYADALWHSIFAF